MYYFYNLKYLFDCCKYLPNMDCPCGFDPRFFKLLKEQFAEKSELQLHGIILLDEMSTRRNLLLDTKTMTYKGLEDYGDNQLKDADQEMADHGLVIMFQPLYDNYSQPIAIFASKGTVPGDKLARIVVQAIALLEQAGAKVHGIVADGGKPNRKMWTELGCSGKKGTLKNVFEHPTHNMDDQDNSLSCNRKVFFFSDAPHLMKTIRNRLENKGKLRVRILSFFHLIEFTFIFDVFWILQVNPDEDFIVWEHFKILHEVDSL